MCRTATARRTGSRITFEMNLPEGALLEKLRVRFAQHVKVKCRQIAITCTVDRFSVDRPFARTYRRSCLLTSELRRSEMSNSQAQLVQTLQRLQVTANRCASSFSN